MTGVETAIEKAGGGPAGKKQLASLFGTTVQFVDNCKRKGWFPLERARQVADVYGMPLADLVKSDLRDVLSI